MGFRIVLFSGVLALLSGCVADGTACDKGTAGCGCLEDNTCGGGLLCGTGAAGARQCISIDATSPDTLVDNDTSPGQDAQTADSGATDTTPGQDTTVADTTVADTTVADTTVDDTTVADTAVVDAGFDAGPMCGDDRIDAPAEICDNAEFGAATCETELQFAPIPGNLVCINSCQGIDSLSQCDTTGLFGTALFGKHTFGT